MAKRKKTAGKKSAKKKAAKVRKKVKAKKKPKAGKRAKVRKGKKSKKTTGKSKAAKGRKRRVLTEDCNATSIDDVPVLLNTPVQEGELLCVDSSGNWTNIHIAEDGLELSGSELTLDVGFGLGFDSLHKLETDAAELAGAGLTTDGLGALKIDAGAGVDGSGPLTIAVGFGLGFDGNNNLETDSSQLAGTGLAVEGNGALMVDAVKHVPMLGSIKRELPDVIRTVDRIIKELIKGNLMRKA